jgi:uncharacterized membrane-anchored protein YhcB (DUF1043 family)
MTTVVAWVIEGPKTFTAGEVSVAFVAGIAIGLLLERWHNLRHREQK